MPLIKKKSKKAFEENVKTEMRADKPQDQAIASAYDVQRRSKKMAQGGMVKPDVDKDEDSMHKASHPQAHMEPKAAMGRANVDYDEDEMDYAGDPNHMPNGPKAAHRRDDADSMDMIDKIIKARKFAKGGMAVDPDMDEDMEDHPEDSLDMIDHVMKKMASGGMVDLQEEEAEHPNAYYELNEDALDERMGTDLDSLHEPADSNEHGRNLPDEDKYDHIDRMMSKMRSKRMR